MKAKAKIRKIATFVEETDREMDRDVSPPTKRAAAVAVIGAVCRSMWRTSPSWWSLAEELGELPHRPRGQL
jgi:hypothetical protein